MGLESEIADFNGRKTGLFIPFWLADLFSDRLRQREQGKACFGYHMNTPFFHVCEVRNNVSCSGITSILRFFSLIYGKREEGIWEC